MIIKDHRLEGERIEFRNSPNHGGNFGDDLPDTIIIHYTAGSSAETSVKTLCNPNAKASAHLVVGPAGEIFQLVPFNVIAWHAGQSLYEGRTGFNKYSISIEIDNAGELKRQGDKYISWFGRSYSADETIEAVHRNQTAPSFWHRYTQQQIEVVLDLCFLLTEKYTIKLILGHEEISPGRKIDPGPAFPLDRLRERVIERSRCQEGPEPLQPSNGWGRVTASYLNIRSGPGLNARKVAKPLPRGTLVNIVREQAGWFEISHPKWGWVKKEYIHC